MATKESETSVLWDMNSCPVSSIFDAGRVGPSTKRTMKNLGYSGRVTITAVGILKRIPTDILRAVYSSGVSLTHVATEKAGHNVIRQFPFVQQVVPPTPVPFPVWESLPPGAIDSGVLDKDAGLLCQRCFSTPIQDFESFTSHLCDNHLIHVIRESPRMVRKRKQPEASSNI